MNSEKLKISETESLLCEEVKTQNILSTSQYFSYRHSVKFPMLGFNNIISATLLKMLNKSTHVFKLYLCTINSGKM